jgi:hypothetical protein
VFELTPPCFDVKTSQPLWSSRVLVISPLVSLVESQVENMPLQSSERFRLFCLAILSELAPSFLCLHCYASMASSTDLLAAGTILMFNLFVLKPPLTHNFCVCYPLNYHVCLMTIKLHIFSFSQFCMVLRFCYLHLSD